MPVMVNGQTFYRTSEVCVEAAVSRATLFRWLKAGMLGQCRRDRRGWRLYTQDDLRRIRAEVNRIETG